MDLPPSVQPFMSLANLSDEDEYLDIETSAEFQRLENYEPYIFRISLTPVIQTAVQTLQADVYYSTDPLQGEEHVAILTGCLLTRPNDGFFIDADDIDAELGALASLFYNTNGTVSRIRNAQLHEIASRPGGFLWIHKVEVKPDHRGSDLGLQLITQVFKFLRNKWTLAVVLPEPLSSSGVHWDQNAPPHGDHSNESLSGLKLRRYFSRLGFVQAGRDANTASAMYLPASVFFPSQSETLTWKTKHHASSIDVSAPEKHNPEGLHKQLSELILYKGSPSFFNPHPFPLTTTDIDRIDQLLSAGASVHESRALHIAAKQGADAALFQLLVNRGGQVNATDESGDQPLHAAAREISPSIPHLIQLGAVRDVRNVNDETPFDILEATARMEEASIGAFADCKPKPCKRRMRNLRKAMMALIPDELKSQLVEGCLPPRLHKMMARISLHCGAAIRDLTKDIYKNKERLPLSDLNGYLLFLEYLPPDVLIRNEKFDLGFFIGWQHVFNAIALCLGREKVPTVLRIREMLDTGRAHQGPCVGFFEAGGEIEFAIDAVICEARNAFSKDPDHWTSCVRQDDIDALERTPLDDLFNVVRSICFEDCESPPCGPYESSSEVMWEIATGQG